MEADSKRTTMLKIVGIIVSIAVYLIISSLQIEGLATEGVKCLGLLAALVLFLLFNLLPLGIIALLFALAFAFLGIVPQSVVFTNYVVGNFFFIIAIFFLAVGFQETGIGTRVSLYITGVVGNKTKRIVLAYMLATAVISSVMADIPTALVFSALAAEILHENGCMPGESKFGTALVLGIPVAAAVGGCGTPAGSALNVITMSMIQAATGIEISFVQWTAACFPVMIVSVIASWFVLCLVFKPEIDTIEGLSSLQEKKAAMGPMSRSEKIFLAVFLVMLVLWATKNVHGIPLWTVSVIGVTVLFLPGIDILQWETSSKKVEWAIPLNLCTMNLLGVVIVQVGCASWIASGIGFLSSYPEALVIFLLVFIMVVGHYVIPGSLAPLSILTPIIAVMALQYGFNPIALVLALSLGARWTVLFPMSDPVCLVTYQHKYWSIQDATKYGFIMSVPFSLIATVFIVLDVALGLI